MAKPIVVGTAIVGRNKKTHGKQGVVQQVSGTSHSKRLVLKWSDMSITTESSWGICLPSIFEQSKKFIESRGNKRRREGDEADMDM